MAGGAREQRENFVGTVARIDPRDRAFFRSSLDDRGFGAHLAWICGIAIAYVLFAKAGFAFAFTVQQVTAVWPSAGIALAALVLGGYRLWPGVFVGAFAANALTNEPIGTAAAIAAGNTLGPLLGAYLLRRFRFDPSFARVRDALVFVAFGAAIAMTVSATNGVLQLSIAHIVTWPAASHVWLLWWTGDFTGVLIVAPFLLTWWGARWGHLVTGEARPLEITVLFAAVAVSTGMEFYGPLTVLFPLYPFVVWIALRAGARMTMAATLVSSAFAVWGTAHGHGPFAHAPLDRSLMQLVIFTAVLTITGLVISALTSERRTALAQMEAAEQRFKVLAETVPQIVWTADATGTIDWFNQRWRKFTGLQELALELHDGPALIAAGKSFEREVQLRRPDGSSRWFLLRAEPMLDERGRVLRWYGTYTDVDDQQRALERSSRIATTLQSAFLPATLPAHPEIAFDALYLTASEEVLIGGDWYDVFVLGDDRVVVSIGDVTGHGLHAAVNAGRIRESILATAIDVDDPAQILTKVNRLLQFREATIATALVAVVDPKALTIAHATAGHPAPIVAGPRMAAHLLPYGGLPLGVSPAPEYRTDVTSLEPGALIAFYTDGITEFQRDIEATERLLRAAIDDLVAAPVAHPASALRRCVLGEAAPVDDAVLLVLRVGSAPEHRASGEARLSREWSFHASQKNAAQNARHEVMRFIKDLAPHDADLTEAEVIVGEILAHTVEHSPGVVNLLVDWSEAHPVVTLVDTGPGLGRFAAQASQEGRAMQLIQALARHVSVESDSSYGTRMTVMLPVERRQP